MQHPDRSQEMAMEVQTALMPAGKAVKVRTGA
jgi:hypothetical protein